MKSYFLALGILLASYSVSSIAGSDFEYRSYKAKKYKKTRRSKANINRKKLEKRTPEKKMEITASFIKADISMTALTFIMLKV